MSPESTRNFPIDSRTPTPHHTTLHTHTHRTFRELLLSFTRSRDSSVDVATRYGLDCPGIESRWERDIPHPSRPALGPTQPSVQWVQGLSWGSSGRDVTLTTHPNIVPLLMLACSTITPARLLPTFKPDIICFLLSNLHASQKVPPKHR